MTNRIWILGASDPEMTVIESLLRECGEDVVYAMIGERRVSAAEAYHADCAWIDPATDQDWWDDIITVECWPTTRVTRRIDHHRPGDPGFGAPPEDFLRASSLGQVIAELARLGLLPESWPTLATGEGDPVQRGQFRGRGGHPDQPHYPLRWTVVVCAEGETGGDWGADAGMTAEVPRYLVLTAAADHCLGHAYAGRCPGVDPDELMRWRVESRAKFQGRSADEILADIAVAKAALEAAPWTILGSESVLVEPGFDGAEQSEHWYDICARDMLGRHVPELPEAGTRYGIPYVADGLPDAGGRIKTVCSGPADVIRAFLDWAPRVGLVDCYGDPERGFAGAYSPEATNGT